MEKELKDMTPAERWEREVARRRAYSKTYQRRKYHEDPVFRRKVQRRALRYYRKHKTAILARQKAAYHRRENS